jgi:hypothetical protein
MTYTPEAIRELENGYETSLGSLHNLLTMLAKIGAQYDGMLREHLSHGAARRIKVIRKALENIFSIFPPTREHKLESDELADAQINVHAFCINVSGFLDNLAWSFVLRHDLLGAVGGQRGVDLFKKVLRGHLPEPINNGVSAMKEWQSRYLKNYRDALAHRIPLYIPPFLLTNDETERYEVLEARKLELLFGDDHEAYLAAAAELDAMGRVAPVFLHSFEFDQEYQPLMLHPQLIADCAKIVEFGDLFLQNWQSQA